MKGPAQLPAWPATAARRCLAQSRYLLPAALPLPPVLLPRAPSGGAAGWAARTPLLVCVPHTFDLFCQLPCAELAQTALWPFTSRQLLPPYSILPVNAIQGSQSIKCTDGSSMHPRCNFNAGKCLCSAWHAGMPTGFKITAQQAQSKNGCLSRVG